MKAAVGEACILGGGLCASGVYDAGEIEHEGSNIGTGLDAEGDAPVGPGGCDGIDIGAVQRASS